MMAGRIIGGVAKLKYDSTVNVVFDGNSLIYGQGGAQNLPRVAAKSKPFASYDVVAPNYTPDATALAGSPTNKWQTDQNILVLNNGNNGDTWRKMNGLDGGGGGAVVDAAYDPAKTNILIIWEFTNTIVSGRTVLQAISDMQDYISARLAANAGWHIILGTCLPRQLLNDQAGTYTLNANLDDCNTRIRAGYKGWNIKALFDVRAAGSPFNFPNYDDATFEAAFADPAGLWASGETGTHTHLSSNGYYYVMRNFLQPTLLRFPKR